MALGAGSFWTDSKMSFGLNYANGPPSLGAAYHEVNYPELGNPRRNPQLRIRRTLQVRERTRDAAVHEHEEYGLPV
jgi:hypothetical protein